MINRRILRIKAMQSLYSYRRNKDSNYHLAVDEVKEAFNMQLLEVGKEHSEEYMDRELKALEVLGNTILNREDAPESIGVEFDDTTVTQAFEGYNKRNHKDFQSHKQRMVIQAERVYDQYLRLVKLLFDFAKVDEEGLLAGNEALECLEKGRALQALLQRKNVTWQLSQVKQWYRVFKKEEDLVKLMKNNRDGVHQHRKGLKMFVLDFLLKNDQVLNSMEEEDINWEENKDVLQKMLLNSIKLTENGHCEEAELYLLSRNWEDDREFFIELFEECVKQEAFFHEVISGKSKKWAVDRIALVDRILIELAITEMTGFSSIPVKVTINEYIEISKVYSTPKSWQFVNGMLDEIAKKLRSDGKIHKTGRGLMDNK